MPWLVAATVAAAILAIGGARLDVGALALVSSAAFGDLVRRAVREPAVAAKDPTDLASSLAFLAILLAAAFDLGRSAGAERRLLSVMPLAGFGIIAAGLVLRSRAAGSLGASFAVRLAVREDQALIDSGPYRRIRHPNYAALLLVAIGTSLSLWSPWALAATFCVWLPVVLVRIAREERMLLARFDGAYRAYMQRTWRLIVGIY
jgi:protein-S-isoprenylcysteine O-methyltransferase Ste14